MKKKNEQISHHHCLHVVLINRNVKGYTGLEAFLALSSLSYYMPIMFYIFAAPTKLCHEITYGTQGSTLQGTGN